VGGGGLSEGMLADLLWFTVTGRVCCCDLLTGLKRDFLRATIVNIPEKGRLRELAASTEKEWLRVRSRRISTTAKLMEKLRVVHIRLTRSTTVSGNAFPLTATMKL
jgi:hypothetical protein